MSFFYAFYTGLQEANLIQVLVGVAVLVQASELLKDSSSPCNGLPSQKALLLLPSMAASPRLQLQLIV